jgi:asparagine synthase (glutamine-hydrolysing)
MIPPHVKSKGLQTKRLLRRAVRNLLPRQIRRGKKKGFTPPLPLWIRDELRPFLMDLFSGTKIRDTGLLNETYCRTLLQEHIQGKKDNNRQIWTVVALICWLKKFRA